MDKNELESLLMRFSHLGVFLSKNGALLIGKAPHIAEYAWLNVMYPCADGYCIKEYIPTTPVAL